ncbi:hypothetical protein RUND412_010347, partial [Rhizina undulata]
MPPKIDSTRGWLAHILENQDKDKLSHGGITQQLPEEVEWKLTEAPRLSKGFI